MGWQLLLMSMRVHLFRHVFTAGHISTNLLHACFCFIYHSLCHPRCSAQTPVDYTCCSVHAVICCTAPECLAVADRVAVVPADKDQTYTLAMGNLSAAVPPLQCSAARGGAVFVLEPAPFDRIIAASSCGLSNLDTVINVVKGGLNAMEATADVTSVRSAQQPCCV